MQSVLVVSSELWVNTLQRWVLVGLWLLNTISVSLSGLVVSGMVLGFRHFLDLRVSNTGFWTSIA